MVRAWLKVATACVVGWPWPISLAIRTRRADGSMSATGRSSRTMSVATTSILPLHITRMPLRESLLMYGLDTCRWSAYWDFVISRGVVACAILLYSPICAGRSAAIQEIEVNWNHALRDAFPELQLTELTES
jgi:hypothetical protein